MDIESYKQQFSDLIDEHGWAVQGLLGDYPAAYTVGLDSTYEHSEMVIVGLPVQQAHGLLEDLVNRIKNGERFYDKQIITDLLTGNMRALLREVPAAVAQDQFNMAAWYYGQFSEPVPTYLQIMWPDQAGTLPGEPGCDPRYEDGQRIALKP